MAQSTFRKLYFSNPDLTEDNARMRERLMNVKAATDHDITDDASGYARIKAAEESAAKKKVRLLTMIYTVVTSVIIRPPPSPSSTPHPSPPSPHPVSLSSLTRLPSPLYPQAEAARIAKENEAMKQRIKNVKAVTDDDISDVTAAPKFEFSAARRVWPTQ